MNGSEMTNLVTDGVRLVPTTIELLDREDISGNELACVLNVAGPASWPPSFNGPETRAWVRDRLRVEPANGEWYSWYIIATVDDVPTLAGIAGYKGPPDADRRVEIGYAVVEEYQRRGIASAAVNLLCQRAFTLGVAEILAETLPTLIPSQGVLNKAGFHKIGVLVDPDEGEIWRYCLDQP